MNVYDTLNRAIASGIVEANESISARQMLYLQSEVKSRTEGQKALMAMPDVTEVRNTPLTADYDFEMTSADTIVLVETKDRGFRVFDNDDLLLSKRKYNILLKLSKKAKEEGKECWFVSTRFNSMLYIWDMAEAPNFVYFAPLVHRKYTAEKDSPNIVEEMAYFPVDKAKFIGKYSEDNDEIAS